MKKIVMAASSALILCAGAVLAQVSEEAPELSFTPVETFTCNFNEGMGPAELEEVISEWNDWMDSEGLTDYFAITIWATFYGERNFDVGWLGVWPDGESMGSGTDTWLTKGAAVNARFEEVIDCMSHSQFASVQVKEPPEVDMGPGDMFALTFSNCSMKEDKELSDYLSAQKEWNDYAGEHGFSGGDWIMFPVWGEYVEADYDFKAVSSAPNFSALGADWARYASGHYLKSMELFDDVLDCDSPRVYTAMVVRLMEDDD